MESIEMNTILTALDNLEKRVNSDILELEKGIRKDFEKLENKLTVADDKIEKIRESQIRHDERLKNIETWKKDSVTEKTEKKADSKWILGFIFSLIALGATILKILL